VITAAADFMRLITAIAEYGSGRWRDGVWLMLAICAGGLLGGVVVEERYGQA
jgi:hypothetical protein